MTCHARPTYANRPRTRADERKTAEIIKLPMTIASEAYHRGLEAGKALSEQATQRVRWTVRPAVADASMLGLSLGVLLGLFARPIHPLLALSFLCLAVGGGLIGRIVLTSRRAR